MSSLNELYRRGLSSVWGTEDSADAQQKYLDVIAGIRGINSELFKKCDMLFIPNDQYLAVHCGEEILNLEYGCYESRKMCLWSNQLIIPITDVVACVRGFAAFNPFNYVEAKETGDRSMTYYSYSSKDVFPKGKYLYFPGSCYEKAITDGYLLLVDGVFDAASLWCAGFNAGALMGSIPTEWILMQLRFIKRVILIADNDDAGYKLYTGLRRQLKNVELFKQGETKDADELLKSEKRDDFIRALQQVLQNDLVKISTFE